MKKLSLSFLFALPIIAFAQQPPGTEIYLLDLSVKKSSVAVSNPQNITNKPGYDNQPFFHPDNSVLYYTSANADGKTDLIEYNYESKISRRLTNTTEREYSPTVTPDKKFISCIIQRDDGAQDLGKYPIEGGDPIILVNALKVGYHAWIDNTTLLLFVLGDTITLHQYNVDSKKDVILAKSPGRSLHKIPKSSAMSFIHKVSETEWVIKKINADGRIDVINDALAGHEDMTWTPDGKIIMSDGKKLFYYQPSDAVTWQEIKMPEGMPAGTITRVAVNPKGNKIAVVVSE